MASDSGNGGLHDEVKTVTIRIFSSHETAQIAASNLEAHGIECWITSDDGGGVMPNLTAPGGVRLSVRVSDAQAAIALLNAEVSPAEINQIESEVGLVIPPETIPQKKLAFIQVIAGIIIGVLLCLIYQWSNEVGTKTNYQYAKDGKPDKEWIYRDGYLVEFDEDRNLDGDWDHRAFYERGQIIRSEYDNNFDGKVDDWWTFSSDDTDIDQRDTDFNGIPDVFSTYKNGIIQQVDIRPNRSKLITTREIFQNGVLTEILRGGDSNGNFKEDMHYDSFFNPSGTNLPATFELLSPASK